MKHILCLGDSNTYGYDPRSWLGERYGAAVRWTGRIESGERRVYNCGQNGLSIPGRYSYPALRRVLDSRQPLDLICVMLGSNDLLQGASAEETAARMEALLRFLGEAAPGVLLLLIAPPPMELGAWVPEAELIARSRALAERYRRLAQALSLPFADAGNWGVGLCFDGVHFTPEGHAAFAEGLGAVLDTLL